MFPVLQIGPAALPVAPLVLLLGVWVASWLAEREAAHLNMDADAVARIIFTAAIAGLLGARLGYVARNFSAYAADPLGIVALTPATLDTTSGVAVAIVAGFIAARRAWLPLWPTLDALAPGLAALGVALGVAHLASGDAFGKPAQLPWSIVLWDDVRHPSQVYEIIAALLIFGVWWRIRDRRPFDGFGFLLVAALSAAARLFLEAFRGDSTIALGGFRAAQLWALLVLALCLSALGRRQSAGGSGDLNRREREERGGRESL